MFFTIVLFLTFCLAITLIGYWLATGIDYMRNKHPKYKGEDFLNPDYQDYDE